MLSDCEELDVLPQKNTVRTNFQNFLIAESSHFIGDMVCLKVFKSVLSLLYFNFKH